MVLLDCDGPLAGFTAAYLLALAEETGAYHEPAEVDRWAIHECAFFLAAAERKGITPQELRERVNAHVVREGFCAGIHPEAGAKEAVAELMKVADIFVVTSPWDSSPTWMYERLHWVHRHFGIPRGHVIQTGRKHLIRGDIFVDDKASHVVEWQEAWPSGVGILFDMHHNRTDNLAGVARAGWPFVIAAATSTAR